MLLSKNIKLGFSFDKLMYFKFSQYLNESFPIDFKFLPIVIVVNLVHNSKHESPIDVTLFGIVIDVKLTTPKTKIIN